MARVDTLPLESSLKSTWHHGSKQVPTVVQERQTIMNPELVKKALEKVGNPNILVNLISQRVRQLRLGGGGLSRPLVLHTKITGVADIALREIVEDKNGLGNTGIGGTGATGGQAAQGPLDRERRTLWMGNWRAATGHAFFRLRTYNVEARSD